MTKEELKIDNYIQSWNTYRNQLEQNIAYNQKILEGIVKQKTILLHNKLLYKKLLMLAFCFAVVIYMLANINLFLTEIRNAVPFFLVLLLFTVSTIGYGRYSVKLKKANNYKLGVVKFATNINKLLIYEKREMLLSFYVALPILLLTLPQVFSVLFQREDFYSNFSTHLPILIIGCLLSISVGYIVYKKNYTLLSSIKQNIDDYKSMYD